MSEPLYGNQYRITKVCIDGYKDKVLEGRVYQYNSEFNGGICFHSTIEFLKRMESIMEKTNFPVFRECRAFHKTGEMDIVQPTPECKRMGQRATFVVKILFRQHTSWQGTVTWCEKNHEQSFRSVLELLFLIDSAIEE